GLVVWKWWGNAASKSQPDGPFPPAGPWPRVVRGAAPPPCLPRTCGGSLLNHLIRPPQHGRRDRQPESFGCFQIDHEFELGGVLNRQIRWLGAPEDLVHVSGGTARHVGQILPVRHEAARVGESAPMPTCG